MFVPSIRRASLPAFVAVVLLLHADITVASDIGLAETLVEVDEQAGHAWLTFQRRIDSVGVASVDFATADDTATAPADYYPAAGTVTWPDGDATDKTVAIAIRPDAFAEGSESLTVTLGNPVGATLDPASSSGTVTILDPGERYDTFAPAPFESTVHVIEPLPNGQVLIGGAINHDSGEFADVHNLARLNPDGSVDATFVTGTGFNGPVRALAVQDDGKIIVGGEFTNYNGTTCSKLIRLRPDGSIDTNIGGVDDGDVLALAIESDGAILLGGSFSSFDGAAAEGLVRLTPAGTRDTVDPLALPFVTGWNSAVRAIEIEPDGRLMVAGDFYLGGSGGFRSGIARLETDGSRDPTFDPGNGTHLLGFSNSLRAVHALARQPDGKYVIGGAFTAIDGRPAAHMARLESDGSFDSFFAPPAFNAPVHALGVQPGGRVLVGGSFQGGGQYLAALQDNGAQSSTFAIGSGPGGPIHAIAQSAEGALYLGGEFVTFNSESVRPIVKLAGGISPYLSWANRNFSAAQHTSGEAGPNADPDGDGARNAAERVLGTDPNAADSSPSFGPNAAGTVVLHERGGQHYLQVTVEKGPASSGAWFVAQFTGRSMTWSPAPPVPGANPVYDILEDGPARFTVRDKIPLGTDSRFVRIGISHPE